MTNEAFYEVLGGIHEQYVQEARDYRPAGKPAWSKWCAAAACLCCAVLTMFLIQHLGGRSGPAAEQPGASGLVVNEVDSVTQLDMDVRLSHYTDASGEAWDAATDTFAQAAGMSYEGFLDKLPASYQLTAFYSIDAPAVPKSGTYVPHDYVFEFLTEQGGKVKIAVCAGEAPLRDHFFTCSDPAASTINGTTALLYRAQDHFMAQFSYGALYYDIDTYHIPLEEVEALLTCITGG